MHPIVSTALALRAERFLLRGAVMLKGLKIAFTLVWAVVSIGALVTIPFVRPETVVVLVVIAVALSGAMWLMMKFEKKKDSAPDSKT